MTPSQQIELRQTEIPERIAEITKLTGDSYSEEVQAEERALQGEFNGLGRRKISSEIAEGEDLETAKREAGGISPELRERIELRSKASLGRYLVAAMRGSAPRGAEAELQAAAGVDGIPIELFEPAEERAITPAPGTTGINLDPIRPAVFAPSIAEKLMIDMPRVPSGTFATGTVTTSTKGDAVAKGTEVPQMAGAITVGTAGPKRVGASLGLAIEDIAAIGQANFEAILRQNVSMALSEELDDQFINGDGAGSNLSGILSRLTDPADPAAMVETWERMLAIQASGIDGLWATELSQIAIVVNPETYRLAAATFQGADAEESAAFYMTRVGAGFWTNSRMPAKDANVAAGILCRKGRPGMRTAVAPVWGELSVDDIYTGARKGERYFTVSAIVGDVLIVQADAYEEVAFRVSV